LRASSAIWADLFGPEPMRENAADRLYLGIRSDRRLCKEGPFHFAASAHLPLAHPVAPRLERDLGRHSRRACDGKDNRSGDSLRTCGCALFAFPKKPRAAHDCICCAECGGAGPQQASPLLSGKSTRISPGAERPCLAPVLPCSHFKSDPLVRNIPSKF
jgi:hypothetical protein